MAEKMKYTKVNFTNSITERFLLESKNELCSYVLVLDPNTWAEELTPEYG